MPGSEDFVSNLEGDVLSLSCPTLDTFPS